MANFMKKVPKAPRPLKPAKAISEVDSIKNESAEEKKVKEIKNPEQSERKEKVSEKTEPVVADPKTGRLEGETEEERIDRQVEEMFGSEEEVKEDLLGEVPWLDKEKKKKFKELKGSANSEVDLNKVRDELKEENTEPKQEEKVLSEPEPKPEPEVKPKSKKKSSKKKKKEEAKVEPKENKEPVDLEKAEELMLDIIMPCAEGWAEEKEKINGMLSKIVITEELDPTSVKLLIADMSKTLREIIMLSTEAKVALANLKDIIEEVKTVSSVGSNSEERKMNAMYAIKNYEYEESIVDLTVLLKFYRERQEFYEAAVKEIEINRQMLITFGSVFKLELAKAY